MKKYLPLVIVLTIIVIVGGAFLLFGGENEPTNVSPSQSTESTGSSSAQPPAPTPPTPNPSVTPNSKVEMKNNTFSPANLTVKKGTTVIWTNNDPTLHNVIGDSSSGPNSQNMQQDDTYSFTFNTTGEYSYQCTFHPGMVGKVTVID